MPTSPIVASDYHIPIMPAKTTAASTGSPACAPARSFRVRAGRARQAEAQPELLTSGLPYFDEVEFLTIADVAARTNALTTGEVHWIGRPDLKTLSLLKRNPDVAITELTGYGHYVFPMHVNVAPFDNVDVRIALKWAINREEIAKKVFLGHATAGNDNPIAGRVKFAIDPQPKFTYDPEKAKFHLKKAGLETLKVDLSVADAAFNGAVDAAVLYQETRQGGGHRHQRHPRAERRLLGQRVAEEALVRGLLERPSDGDWMFTTAYAAGAALERDALGKSAVQRAADPGPRRDRREEARGDVCRDAAAHPRRRRRSSSWCSTTIVEAYSKKLAHGNVAGNWEADGFKIAERWWFA